MGYMKKNFIVTIIALILKRWGITIYCSHIKLTALFEFTGGAIRQQALVVDPVDTLCR